MLANAPPFLPIILRPLESPTRLDLGAPELRHPAAVFVNIQLARQQVADRFGVNLELEIELLGKW